MRGLGVAERSTGSWLLVKMYHIQRDCLQTSRPLFSSLDNFSRKLAGTFSNVVTEEDEDWSWHSP